MGEKTVSRQWELKLIRWEFLASLCVEHGLKKGAELGVKEGRFTYYLVRNVPGLYMLAVDTWAPVPNSEEDYSDWNFEEMLEKFRAAVAPYMVTIYRMTTHQAAGCAPDGLDFVFIDADHSYEGVKQDLADWVPKIRSGGLVSGHDIDWPGVERAVSEVFPNYKVGPNKVWYAWKS